MYKLLLLYVCYKELLIESHIDTELLLINRIYLLFSSFHFTPRMDKDLQKIN